MCTCWRVAAEVVRFLERGKGGGGSAYVCVCRGMLVFEVALGVVDGCVVISRYALLNTLVERWERKGKTFNFVHGTSIVSE